MKTALIFILDRSGSMSGRIEDVVGGFNSLIEDQRKDDSEDYVTLTIFDNHIERLYTGEPIENVSLDTERYRARGSTALYDAIVDTVDQEGARFATMQEDDRPDKVMVMIFTDGFENSSQHTSQEVAQRIRHQEQNYNWEFTFIGADQDAALSAANIGIRGQSSLSNNSDNYIDTMKVVSRSLSVTKLSDPGVGFNYSSEDRQAVL